MTQPPSAQELTSGSNLKQISTARGIYRNLDPKNDITMRFAYAAPDRWVWLHRDGAPSGAITDGTTNVIVEDGVAALVADAGKVHTSHRLMNLLNPMRFKWGDAEFSEPVAGEAIGRSAWLMSAIIRKSDESRELAFDQATGVLLYMKNPDLYLGFDELFLDEEIQDGIFRWDGPVEQRKIGSALVFRMEDGTTYGVLWEVSIKGRSLYHQEGLGGVTLDEAVAWGEERAARVRVREE